MRNVYRAKNSLKAFFFVFLAFSLFFSFGVWRGISGGTNTWIEFAIGIVLVCVGASYTAKTLTTCVVLSEDSISYRNAFRRRSLQLKQIRYRREYEEYQDGPDGGINVHYLELVPYDGASSAMKISKDDFDFDQAFWESIFRIPDVERLTPPKR